jgi:hypothetical protein
VRHVSCSPTPPRTTSRQSLLSALDVVSPINPRDHGDASSWRASARCNARAAPVAYLRGDGRSPKDAALLSRPGG